MIALSALLSEVRACTLCAEHLPYGPRPVLQLHPSARVLIAAQAPGRKVHETGIPFNDASGDRLRAVFYDAQHVAILPMGFCFPGKGASGDLPPRPECARRWRSQLVERLRHVRLTIVIGSYAQVWHLPDAASLTEAVRQGPTASPSVVALPHPSPRNNGWLKRNPWFEADILPALPPLVARALAS
jgi:uracil-DNA glycosylase